MTWYPNDSTSKLICYAARLYQPPHLFHVSAATARVTVSGVIDSVMFYTKRSCASLLTGSMQEMNLTARSRKERASLMQRADRNSEKDRVSVKLD